MANIMTYSYRNLNPAGKCASTPARVAKPIRGRIDVAAVFAGLLDTVLVWQERARQRHQLAEMDDRLLKDMGISRAAASREIDKPFWQA